MAVSEKEIWAQYTRDAIGKYNAPDEGFDNPEDLIDDMIEFVTSYADGMLDELEERFETQSSEPRRPRARKRKTEKE